MRHRMRLVALLVAVLPAGSAHAQRADPARMRESTAVYQRLARTINLDLAMEDAEHWGEAVKESHLDACRRAGFTAVRLPISWQKYTSAAPPYAIDPAILARMDRLAGQIAARGLAVIVDYHKDKSLTADPAASRDRFLSITEQVAAHFQRAPPGLVLEPYAEPYGKLDRVWNEYFGEALARIRRTNSRRAVLVGPPGYNSIAGLRHLRLPPDPDLIVCVHVYRPLPFVFQGEDFFPGSDRFRGTRWTDSAREHQELAHELDIAMEWARVNQRPLFIEEFGCTNNADLESRVRWTRFFRGLIESRHLPWGVWAFGPNFSIYDLVKGNWKRPLLEALIPGQSDRRGSGR